MSGSDYHELLKPIKIGSHTWKNRIVKGPSSSRAASREQYCTDTVVGVYEAMAKGGAAAVILGAMVCDDPSTLIEQGVEHRYLGLYDDRFIEPLKRLTDAVHAHGCEAIAQIYQNGTALNTIGGAWCSSSFNEDELPSPAPYCYPTRALSIDEIHAFEGRYLDAAERAKKAGFDGVEVHAANGYMICSFVSRIWNHRHDEYGCDTIENRTRLACELISGVKERCGDDFIVGVRMNGQEFGHPDAITPDEAVEIAPYYERAGAEYISVTGYGYGPVPFQYSLDYWQTPEADSDMVPFLARLGDGLMIEPAAQVKKHVGVPVFGIGSLDIDKAERLIEDGKIDIGLFARGLWADPEIANKLIEGRASDIRKCTHCATCDMPVPGGGGRRCRVNPQFCREREISIEPAEERKRVLVVGGGASGLEAARVAAQRGHEVVLCEKQSVLAIELNLATMVKGTACEDVPSLINWLTEQAMKQKGLTIKLKTEVTPEYVAKMSPDVVIVATGGKYEIPDIPGIDSKNVCTLPELTKIALGPLKIFGSKALSSLSKVALPGIGKKCVILGAQIEAIQGAVFLSQRGRQVTLLEDSDDKALRMPTRYANRDLSWLAKNGIDVITGVEYVSIDKSGVNYLLDGEEKRLVADSVMVFKSPVEDHSFAESIEGLAPEIYTIGSCNGTDQSLMVDALRTGREVACRI